MKSSRLALTLDQSLRQSLDRLHAQYPGFKGDDQAAVFAIHAAAEEICRRSKDSAQESNIPENYRAFADEFDISKQVERFHLKSLVYGLNLPSHNYSVDRVFDHPKFWADWDGNPTVITLEPYLESNDPAVIEFQESCEALCLVCEVGQTPPVHHTDTVMIVVRPGKGHGINLLRGRLPFWLWIAQNTNTPRISYYPHPVFSDLRLETTLHDLRYTIGQCLDREEPGNLSIDRLTFCSRDQVASDQLFALKKAYLEDLLQYLSGDHKTSVTENFRVANLINRELLRLGALRSPYADVIEYEALPRLSNLVDQELILQNIEWAKEEHSFQPKLQEPDVITLRGVCGIYDGRSLLNELRSQSEEAFDWDEFELELLDFRFETAHLK